MSFREDSEMAVIEPVTTAELAEEARLLFRAYGDFLRGCEGHADFHWGRFEREIAELPAAYAGAGGEVLVAREGTAAAGCIAYRLHPGLGADCCEVKRLFVAAEFRARGWGAVLVDAVLERARLRGYRAACLDTEPRVMAAAYGTYVKAGFVEYDRRVGTDGVTLVFLRRELR